MQRFKRALAVVLAAAALLAMSVTASAVSGVSTDEQMVLDMVYAAAVNHGVSDNETFMSCYEQAESWMEENELTKEQCSTLAAAIGEAAAGGKSSAGADRNKAVETGGAVKPWNRDVLDGKVTACVVGGLALAFMLCSITAKRKGLFASESLEGHEKIRKG